MRSAILLLAVVLPSLATSQVEPLKPWQPVWPEPTHEALAYSASPNAPTLLVGAFRGARGKVAAALPLVDREKGRFFLHLLPLIELSNESGAGSIIPSQAWRGRLVLRGGLRFGNTQRRLSVGLALEHESDHHTEEGTWVLFGERDPPPVHDPVAIVYNGAALRTVAVGRFGRLTAFGVLRASWHLVTCTVPGQDCDVGLFGGSGGEVGGELGASYPLGPSPTPSVILFASMEASLLRGRKDVVLPEQRVSLRAGAAFPTRSSGAWSLSLRLLFGHDTGVFGHEDPGVHPGLTAEFAF